MKPRSRFLSFFLVAGAGFTVTGAGLAFSEDTQASLAGLIFLLIGVIWIAVALAIRAVYSSMGRKAVAEQQLFETGSRAIAEVEGVQTTGLVLNRVNQQIILSLRVQPTGEAEFPYRRKMFVPFNGPPRTGDLIEVAFEPGDRTTVALQTDWRSATAGGRLLVTRPPGEPPPAGTSRTEPERAIAQLERLSQLKHAGVLTETEFEQQKTRLLSDQGA